MDTEELLNEIDNIKKKLNEVVDSVSEIHDELMELDNEDALYELSELKNNVDFINYMTHSTHLDTIKNIIEERS